MMFSAMLMDAFQDSDSGFLIRYRFDGIFNLRRLQAKTKVQTDVLRDELLYADDMDKNASLEATMQWIKQVSKSCDNYDLTISTKRQGLHTNQHLENSTMN